MKEVLSTPTPAINKSLIFYNQIRRRQIQASRNKIREELDKKFAEYQIYQVSQRKQMIVGWQNADTTYKIFTQLQNLQQYSLLSNEELWSDHNIINSIFGILNKSIYEEGYSHDQKNAIIFKVIAIFKKMLRNQIEWIASKIQFIILGSSVCLPVFLTILQSFSRSCIPIYKKSVELGFCKATNILKDQIINNSFASEKFLGCSAFNFFIKILKQLFIEIPKIRMKGHSEIFKLFFSFLKISSISEIVAILDKDLIIIIFNNINQHLVTAEQKNDFIRILQKLLSLWNYQIASQKKQFFFQIINKICGLSQYSDIQNFIVKISRLTLQMIKKELSHFKQDFTDMKLILKVLESLNNILIVDNSVGTSFVNQQNISQQLLLKILVFAHNIYRSGNRNFRQQMAYFYYYALIKIEVNQIDQIFDLSELNHLIYSKLDLAESVTDTILWLKVAECLIGNIISQGMIVQEYIEDRLINLIQSIFSNHAHQEVTGIAENTLQIISYSKQ